jgi:hypothetical protein
MEAHQQRVVDEKAALDEKLAKLNIFLSGAVFSGLDMAEQERLTHQGSIMTQYSQVLRERIAAFKTE